MTLRISGSGTVAPIMKGPGVDCRPGFSCLDAAFSVSRGRLGGEIMVTGGSSRRAPGARASQTRLRDSLSWRGEVVEPRGIEPSRARRAQSKQGSGVLFREGVKWWSRGESNRRAPGARKPSKAQGFFIVKGGSGGAEGNRTPDLVIANDALSQLSYGPIRIPAKRASRVSRRHRKTIRAGGHFGRPDNASGNPHCQAAVSA